MPKTTIWTLILSLALTTAAFAATPEEKCQKALSLAWGKYELCVQKATGKYYGGGDFGLKMQKTWASASTSLPRRGRRS